MSIDERDRTALRTVIRLAGAHENVLAWHEMRNHGIHDTEIRRWMAIEFLQSMHRGVVHVGPGQPTYRGRCRGAVLRGGSNTSVGGMAALFLGRAVEREPRRVSLVTTGSGSCFDNVEVRRTTSLPAYERRDYGGIASISVARAIVDVAPNHPTLRLVRWMRNAEFHGTLDIDEVRVAEHRLARRGHGTELRCALCEFDDDNGGTDSKLEDLLLSMMIGAKFPPPKVGQLMPGVLRPNERVDFLFASCGLVIEADGPHHTKPMQRRTDKRRNAQLTAAGYRVLRFWWYEIEREPAKVLDAIRAALRA